MVCYAHHHLMSCARAKTLGEGRVYKRRHFSSGMWRKLEKGIGSKRIPAEETRNVLKVYYAYFRLCKGLKK